MVRWQNTWLTWDISSWHRGQHAHNLYACICTIRSNVLIWSKREKSIGFYILIGSCYIQWCQKISNNFYYCWTFLVLNAAFGLISAAAWFYYCFNVWLYCASWFWSLCTFYLLFDEGLYRNFLEEYCTNWDQAVHNAACLLSMPKKTAFLPSN